MRNQVWKDLGFVTVPGMEVRTGIFFFFFFVPQLYLWGSPLLGEIFAHVTVF